MLRDVFIASINKGQFLFAIVGFVVAIMILKMPAADVSKLVFRMLDAIESAGAVGFILAIAVAGAWFWHARWQRRVIGEEMRRVCKLRTELQAQLLGKKLKSSGVSE
jgi:hypothetical protein